MSKSTSMYNIDAINKEYGLNVIDFARRIFIFYFVKRCCIKKRFEKMYYQNKRVIPI